MKLTAFTDYSLRVLIYLAADPARRATIARDRRGVRHLGEPPVEGGALPRQARAGSTTCAARAAASCWPWRRRTSASARSFATPKAPRCRPNASPRTEGDCVISPVLPAQGRARRGGRRLLRRARPIHARRHRAQPRSARAGPDDPALDGHAWTPNWHPSTRRRIAFPYSGPEALRAPIESGAARASSTRKWR